MEKKAAAELGPILTLVSWFEANRKTALTVAGIAAVVALIAGFLYWRQQQSTVNASEALTDTLVNGTLQRNSQAVTTENLLKLVGEHDGTPAAARAEFQAATVLFVDGKYTEAQTHFQKFIAENSDHPFVPEAMYGVATCLEAQGKIDEAAKSYKGLADRYKTSGLGISATCSLGRILHSQGKLIEALPLFEEVARADPNGMLGSESRIRVAEIQQQLPPPPAIPAATPNPAASLAVTNNP